MHADACNILAVIIKTALLGGLARRAAAPGRPQLAEWGRRLFVVQPAGPQTPASSHMHSGAQKHILFPLW